MSKAPHPPPHNRSPHSTTATPLRFTGTRANSSKARFTAEAVTRGAMAGTTRGSTSRRRAGTFTALSFLDPMANGMAVVYACGYQAISTRESGAMTRSMEVARSRWRMAANTRAASSWGNAKAKVPSAGAIVSILRIDARWASSTQESAFAGMTVNGMMICCTGVVPSLALMGASACEYVRVRSRLAVSNCAFAHATGMLVPGTEGSGTARAP